MLRTSHLAINPALKGPGLNQRGPWPVMMVILTLRPSAPEAETATALITGDTPSVSTTPESLVPPPGKEQTHPMDVDEPDDCQPPASPVSHREDNLLTGGDVVGVEGEMANLKVSSPRGHGDEDGGASI